MQLLVGLPRITVLASNRFFKSRMDRNWALRSLLSVAVIWGGGGIRVRLGSIVDVAEVDAELKFPVFFSYYHNRGAPRVTQTLDNIVVTLASNLHSGISRPVSLFNRLVDFNRMTCCVIDIGSATPSNSGNLVASKLLSSTDSVGVSGADSSVTALLFLRPCYPAGGASIGAPILAHASIPRSMAVSMLDIMWNWC